MRNKQCYRVVERVADRCQGIVVVAGNMPTARYQHGAVFVGARLHISGGAVGGGRMVDDQSSIVVLDTAAGTWCTQAEPSAMNGANGGDGADDWARRWGPLTSYLVCSAALFFFWRGAIRHYSMSC